jgi:hypothetical protein
MKLHARDVTTGTGWLDHLMQSTSNVCDSCVEAADKIDWFSRGSRWTSQGQREDQP